jgi:hypothetical protein
VSYGCGGLVYWYLLVWLLVITGKGWVVDSNVSRRRSDRKQLTVLVDAGLAAAVRAAAVRRGMTLTALVEGALEVCVDDFGVGSAGGGGVGEESGVVRQDGGGGGGVGVVSGVGGGVNWELLLAQGREERVVRVERDPIEEIA